MIAITARYEPVRLRSQEMRTVTDTSAEGHTFDAARWSGVGEAQHPERVEQAEERGEEGYQQGSLKGQVPGIGVDADDLLAGRRRLPFQLFLQRGVAHDLGVVLQGFRNLLLLGR